MKNKLIYAIVVMAIAYVIYRKYKAKKTAGKVEDGEITFTSDVQPISNPVVDRGTVAVNTGSNPVVETNTVIDTNPIAVSNEPTQVAGSASIGSANMQGAINDNSQQLSSYSGTADLDNSSIMVGL